MLYNAKSHHYYGATFVKDLYTIYNMESKKTLVKKTDTDTTYVIFKGTSRRQEWKHNLNIKLNDNHIHTGFNEYAQECKSEIDLVDILTKSKDTCIYMCSHSLGASACLILLHDVFKLHNDILSDLKMLDVVLYGCPKTGDSLFIKELEKMLNLHKNIHIYRYVLQNDIVTNYPFSKEYEHIGNAITLEDEETSIYDAHFIDTYISNLKKQNVDTS
jgi:predicted lipase|uniref:Fungal lipase-type domain-containing protein n=1 Tax=viral metagenome TaxID=1070528 RepID=A0A6C0BNT4_9ZZZZ